MWLSGRFPLMTMRRPLPTLSLEEQARIGGDTVAAGYTPVEQRRSAGNARIRGAKSA